MQAATQTVRFPASLFTYDCDGVLARIARVEALQKGVHVALQAWLLHLSYYPTLARQPLEPRMFNPMTHHFLPMYLRHYGTSCVLPHMAINMHTTLKICLSKAQDGSQMEHECKFQLFPAARPLLFVAFDILGSLQNRPSGNQHVAIWTYHNLKLIRAFFTPKITSTHSAIIFVDNLISLSGIEIYVLEDNGLQFVCKFSTTSWIS